MIKEEEAVKTSHTGSDVDKISPVSQWAIAPEWTQVAVAVDGVPGQFETCQFG